MEGVGMGQSPDGRQRVNQVRNHDCFGCGAENPIGLQLEFWRDDDGVVADFTPPAIYQGYQRVIHGGIIATLLDEAMSWAVIESGRLAVTATMELQLRRPIYVGEPVRVRGFLSRERGRIVEATGEIRSADGILMATAQGTFVRVSAEQQREWEAIYVGSPGS